MLTNSCGALIENNNLVIGIDATNLRRGGGRTHIIELMRVSGAFLHLYSKIVIWGSESTLCLIDDFPWIVKVNPIELEGNLWTRANWQRQQLSDQARKYGCSILFIPGGSYTGNFHPVVTMSQNLLPFEFNELKRYGLSVLALKLIILRFTQKTTFQRSDGVIFLSNYAKKTVENIAGNLSNTTVIPHGINARFFMHPRYQKSIEKYSIENPYRLLYVSIVDVYKHQWNVIEAVSYLRHNRGWPIALELVGQAYPPALQRLNSTISKFDPDHTWIHYHGEVAFDELHRIYQNADLGIFASSCENMPNILLENMAAGLPIASSSCGPMHEILGQCGVYFVPTEISSIISALDSLITNTSLRSKLSQASYERAQSYKWLKCAEDTFSYLTNFGI
jgi:glycosyltransferase involved in cell wall biosynthesis